MAIGYQGIRRVVLDERYCRSRSSHLWVTTNSPSSKLGPGYSNISQGWSEIKMVQIKVKS